MNVLEEGLDQLPNSMILLLCTGEVHSQCGDMVKAIKMFHKASLLQAGHPLPWVNAARTYQQLGQLTAATSHIEVALALDPSLAMTRVDKAQLLRQAGSQFEKEAVQNIDCALDLARQVSEIRDVMTARYVTLLQQSLQEKGLYTHYDAISLL
jgi:tetratricopeptide (TPR) repeat protein